MNRDSNRIVFLDWLRVIACFMVMLVHACEAFYFDAEGHTAFASLADARWVSWMDAPCRSSVPLFVLASSFLLFPLKRSTGDFFRRRFVRVIIPFVVWSFVYIFWNGFSGGRFDWSAIGSNLGRLCFNFPMTTGGHMWFVPMLLGLYLLMPLLSPWAEKASEKEVRGWLLVWLFTTTFPFLRKLWSFLFATGADPTTGMLWSHVYGLGDFGNIPFLWGECGWNGFGTFHYVSGFFGYLLLGLWVRKFLPELNWRKTLAWCVPLWLVGYAIVGGFFYFRIPFERGFPQASPYALAVDLEMSWEFCTLGVALTTVAYFLVIRKFTADGWFYARVVRPMSEASYGTYLMHMLFLSPFAALYRQHLPTPVTIVVTAVSAYACAMATSVVLRKIPKIGPYIAG